MPWQPGKTLQRCRCDVGCRPRVTRVPAAGAVPGSCSVGACIMSGIVRSYDRLHHLDVEKLGMQMHGLEEARVRLASRALLRWVSERIFCRRSVSGGSPVGALDNTVSRWASLAWAAERRPVMSARRGVFFGLHPILSEDTVAAKPASTQKKGT